MIQSCYKNRQKIIQKHWYLLHWIYQKISDYENIHSVNSLYLITSEVDGQVEGKKLK